MNPANTIAIHDEEEDVIEEHEQEIDIIEESIADDESEVDETDDESEDGDDDLFAFDDDQEAEEDALQNEAEEDAEGDAGKTDDSAEVASKETEEVLTAGASAANASDDLALYDQITDAALARVKEITGEEYDEFDPKHKVILMTEAGKIATKFEARLTADKQAAAIVADCGGEPFQKFLADQSGSLTKREYDAMTQAEQRGDFSLTLGFMKKKASEFKYGTKAREKAAAVNKGNIERPLFSQANKSMPPRTISSGTGAAPVKKKNESFLSPEDLGLDV